MIIKFFWDAFDMGFKMARESKLPITIWHVISDKNLEADRKQLIDDFMRELGGAWLPEVLPTQRARRCGESSRQNNVSTPDEESVSGDQSSEAPRG